MRLCYHNTMGEHDDLSFRDLFVPFTDRKAIIFIILAGLAVFFFSLFNGFVWDDKTYIIYNPAIASASFTDFFTPNLFNTGGQYRPLPYLYFSLFYRLLGAAPLGYHLLQITLHIVNACLVFLLFRHFFGRKTSLFLSLIFLVHPLQVESVAYIAATGSPLFMLFGMAALHAGMNKRIGHVRASAIGCLLFLSLLARETGAVFIPIIAVYRLIYRRNDLGRLAGGLMAALSAYLLVRLGAGHAFLSKAQVLVPIAKLSFQERLINVPAVFFYYLRSFVYPAKITIAQLWTVSRLTLSDFWLPLLADTLFVVASCFIGWRIYRKKRPLFPVFVFFTLWFVMAIGLHLQIFPLDWTVSDRWFYLPIIGLAGMIGASFSVIRPPPARSAIFLAAIAVTVLSVRTAVRCYDWRDAIALYTHDSKIADNYDIENNLGGEYGIFRADYKNALIHYKKSVELFAYDGNTFNLASMYEQLGEVETAKNYFYQSLSYGDTALDKGNVLRSYQHIGQILVLYGDANEAKRFLTRALGSYPHDATLLIELAVARYKLSERDGALQAATEAVSRSSDPGIAYTYRQIKAGEPVFFFVRGKQIIVGD